MTLTRSLFVVALALVISSSVSAQTVERHINLTALGLGDVLAEPGIGNGIAPFSVGSTSSIGCDCPPRDRSSSVATSSLSRACHAFMASDHRRPTTA